MPDLINAIRLDSGLKQKVMSLTEKDRTGIMSLADKCCRGSFSCLAYKDDLTRLAVMLKCAERAYAKYRESDIDDSIYYDTFDDIRIWCENNGNTGLKKYRWIENHVSLELFKIGRLQYQFYTCKNITLKYNLLPFDYGEKVIYIHIPQGEKLIYSDCVDSLKRAKAFFAEHFPDYKYRFFFCESWLLYGENWQFMEPSCNILQFSSLFDIVYSCNSDAQAIERIFGKRMKNTGEYSENTTLQRNAKAYMLNGGKLGMGIGVIDVNDI